MKHSLLQDNSVAIFVKSLLNSKRSHDTIKFDSESFPGQVIIFLVYVLISTNHLMNKIKP